MSSILNGISEAKRSPEPDYNDPSWDEKVSNVGQKAKQAQALKAKGKEPRTRWNPETKKYYVDFSDDEKKVEEGVNLSPEQIQQIFKGAENIETSAGANRSIIGKAKDLMTKNQPQSTTPTVRQYSNNPTSRPTTTPTSGLSAIAPKRATAKPGEINGLPMRESVELTESQIYRLIGKIVEQQKQVDEGLMDYVRTKGQNLTNKITADKLLQAWKNSGSSTDSDAVAKVMVGAGVPQETVNNLMKNFVQGPSANTSNPNMWQGVDRSIPPGKRTQQAPANIATTGAPTSTPSTAPAATGTTPMPAGWRPSDAIPGAPLSSNTATTTNATRGPIGKKAGIQAVNQAVATVKKVKSNLRPSVAKYGEEQFDKISWGGQEFKPGDPMYDKMKAASGITESVGLPYPGTYEETNDMFKSTGQRRIGTLTTEDDQIDGMAQGEIREIIKNAIHIKNQLDKGVSLDGWMYSYVTTSNDHLNSVAEQINNPNIDEEKVRLDPKCWTGKHKEGTKIKGGVRVNNCVPNESAILKGLNQIDEGWKSALGSAALAGAMAMGSGHAQAADLSQFGTPYLQQVASGQHPRPMVNVDDAKAELQAREQGKQQTVAPAAAPETTSGFSIDYLKKASDTDRTGRYLISVEKAQEMLKQATAPKARPALNIAPGDYPAAK